MASNQLALARKDMIVKESDRLFGRVLRGMRCPLTFEERIWWARSGMSPEELDALRVLAGNSVLNSRTCFELGTQYRPGEQIVRVNVFQHDSNHKNQWFEGVPTRHRTVSYKQTEDSLGVHRTEVLFQWIRDAVRISVDIMQAEKTVTEVLEMVKTPGHLHRMVPELYKLAGNPGVISRASAVPYEWSAYPRSKVTHLVDTLTKMSLLAEPTRYDVDACRWSVRSNWTWPVFESVT